MKSRTRIAGLHVDNSKPVSGEEIRIAGYLQWYDESAKRWEPLRDWVKLVIDGLEIARTITKHDGSFEFKYSSVLTGKKKIEVRYAGKEKYKPCKGEITIEVITKEQRKKFERVAKIALIVLFVLIVIIILLSILLTWKVYLLH
ncbi:MAG TPA: hypothetical protein EYG81_00065 [Archaeoglobus profundus]|nr:hypothetical protein [Archaeoglobus profundus]